MSEGSGTVEAKRAARWTRIAGLGAMVGAGAVLVAAILDNVTEFTATPGTVEYVTAWSMFAVGGLLLLVGALALHVRYGGDYGRLGALGTAVAGLGFLSMVVGAAWSAVSTGPVVDASASGGLVFAGLLLAVLGSFALAVGLRRSGVARAGTLLLVAPVLLVATFVVGEALVAVVALDALWLLFLVTFCAGWIALGDALRSGPESTVAETTAPTA